MNRCMNQHISTNKHKDKSFTWNEWINEWINTYKQISIKIKALPAINKSTKKEQINIWKPYERPRCSSA